MALWEWLTAERLQTLALIGAITLTALVHAHDRAHCRTIGSLRSRVAELERRLDEDRPGGDPR